MHCQEAKYRSAAAGALRDNQLRCAACRCGGTVVAARYHYRRPRPRSAEVQRRCSAASKHGTHREHGSATPHTDAGSQLGSAASEDRRKCAGGFRTVER